MKIDQQRIWTLVMLLVVAGVVWYYAAERNQPNEIVTGIGNQVQIQQQSTPTAPPTQQPSAAQVQQQSATTPSSTQDYFASLRLSRNRAEDQSIAQLQETLANGSADSQAAARAQQQLNQLLAKQEKQAQAEEQLKAEGYKDAVVMGNQDRVNVTVAAPSLSSEQVVQIIATVAQHMGVPATQIAVSYHS